MSTKEIPDIGEMYDFYQMKIDFMQFLKMVHNHDNKGMFTFSISDKEKLNMFEDRAEYLINKIESLGKKEEK